MVRPFAASLFAYILLSSCSFVQFVESDIYTGRFPSSSNFTESRVVIVDIDRPSLDALGGWPLKRSLFVKAAQIAYGNGAKVVAFDVVFNTEQDGDDDSQMANLARVNKATVFAVDEVVEKALFSSLLNASPTFGHVHAALDAKERVIAIVRKPYAPSLSEAIAVAFCTNRPPSCYASSANKDRPPTYGLEQDSSWGINYSKPIEMFPRISLHQLLLGGRLPNLQDKIVIVAPSAPRLGDMKWLPFDWKMPAQAYPGTFAVAYGVETLLKNHNVWSLPSFLLISLLGLFNALVLLIASKRQAWRDLVLFLAGLFLLAAQYFLFKILYLNLPISFILMNSSLLWMFAALKSRSTSP
jgi:CHASE2 domain-containing sensor protein